MATTDRAEWLKNRRSGLGGSDMAGVLGVSPWKTPVQVWLDKTGRTPLDGEKTITLRIGNELEDMVAKLYSEETGRGVQRFTKTLRKGCFLGDIDRLVVPEGKKMASWRGQVRTDTILECKTTSQPKWDEVPIYYLTQVLHYLGLVPEADKADLAALFLMSKDFKIFTVERDQELINSMWARASAWWTEYVVGNIQPPPTCEADCKLLWERSNPGKRVEDDGNMEMLIRGALDIKDQIKDLQEQLSGNEDQIKAYMGDAEVLVDAQGKTLCTWKSSKDRVTTDWNGIVNKLAIGEDVIKEFTASRPGSRMFLMKK